MILERVRKRGKKAKQKKTKLNHWEQITKVPISTKILTQFHMIFLKHLHQRQKKSRNNKWDFLFGGE